MLTRIMKWVVMVALIVAALLWRSAANSELPRFLLGFVVCFGAGVVVMQAVRANKYVWAGEFGVIGLLFNPLVPVFPFGAKWGFLLLLLTVVPFAASLVALRTQPLLSIPSITGGDPETRSL